DLKAGETVVGARGLPLPRSGNFADVYQIRGLDGKDWAVKCFTRPVVGLAERYTRVSEALGQAKLPFVVGFKLLAEGSRGGNVGHPAYQHPTRTATRAYSPDLDRFPHLVVLTALKGLEVAGQTLWDRYDTGDNLLFTEDDFKKPAESKVMRELWRTENPAVQA